MDLAVAANDAAAIPPLIATLESLYPEKRFAQARRAAAAVGMLTQAQAEALIEREAEAEREYRRIKRAWQKIRWEPLQPGDIKSDWNDAAMPQESLETFRQRKAQEILSALAPLMAGQQGVPLRAQLLAADVHRRAGRSEDALSILVNLWRSTPADSPFRDEVQSKLFPEADKADREDLLREVLPSAIHARDRMVRLAARCEWVWRLRKLGRHQEIVDLARETFEHWDGYDAPAGQDIHMQTHKAVLLLAAGLASKTLGRPADAAAYFQECRQVSEALPDKVAPIEDRHALVPNKLKAALLDGLKVHQPD